MKEDAVSIAAAENGFLRENSPEIAYGSRNLAES
jgi:hypothetical protein